MFKLQARFAGIAPPANAQGVDLTFRGTRGSRQFINGIMSMSTETLNQGSNAQGVTTRSKPSADDVVSYAIHTLNHLICILKSSADVLLRQ